MSLSELTLTPNYKDINLQAGNWKWIAVVHFRKPWPCIIKGVHFGDAFFSIGCFIPSQALMCLNIDHLATRKCCTSFSG